MSKGTRFVAELATFFFAGQLTVTNAKAGYLDISFGDKKLCRLTNSVNMFAKLAVCLENVCEFNRWLILTYSTFRPVNLCLTCCFNNSPAQVRARSIRT